MYPRIIEFLEPILFFMQELKGANIIEAIENTEIIIETSVVDIAEHSTSSDNPVVLFSTVQCLTTPSQSCFSSVYRGKKAVTFIIIMFPMNKAIKQENIIPFFYVGVNSSSSLSYIFYGLSS